MITTAAIAIPTSFENWYSTLLCFIGRYKMWKIILQHPFLANQFKIIVLADAQFNAKPFLFDN
ncbi:hypothetical protein [Flavobacterium sp. ACAM 123]|uniref:hypothetical protein n=1 Tax=Flavobacterium sp. ACAM 123 TaxID=1189620 RepID=UPI0003758054|nr:hypothetical protein [Flavobacterium sp. ACAM 123]